MGFIPFISLLRIEKEPIRTTSPLLVINEDEKDGKDPFVSHIRPRRPHSQPPPLADRSKGKCNET
jgi:hypothetical protein